MTATSSLLCGLALSLWRTDQDKANWAGLMAWGADQLTPIQITSANRFSMRRNCRMPVTSNNSTIAIDKPKPSGLI